MTITIANLEVPDLEQVDALQGQNLRDNLTPEQLRDGYLSLAYSADEFLAFHRDLAVVVAKEEQQLVGYCCFSSAAYNAQFPILDQLVSQLSTYAVPGASTRATQTSTCIYGPACIAAAHRGTGILHRLFSHGVAQAQAAGYTFCFSFVGAENQRSLQAHLKLPFSQVGEIEYNDRRFVVIACSI